MCSTLPKPAPIDSEGAKMPPGMPGRYEPIIEIILRSG